jgi:hypothetical protein
MNQSILFSDEVIWHDDTIEFHAQHSGMLIRCFITLESLRTFSSQVIESKRDALDIFEMHRFDIEEKAEALIEDESFAVDGSIRL